MQIIPIKDLKDTVKTSQICHKNDKPIFITKNGYGDMVIMSIKAYEQQQEEILVLQRMLNAMQGNTIDADTVFKKAKEIYEI
jgi:prevent-host-death family protein